MSRNLGSDQSLMVFAGSRFLLLILGNRGKQNIVNQEEKTRRDIMSSL